MRILTVDVGTGTQDIFLYDSGLGLENGFKLILPSPTMIVHRRLKLATQQGQAVALSGVMMGGGPSGWAAEAHVKAGYALYATPAAARTLDDDLDYVSSMGIQLISEDEIDSLPGDVFRLALRDFDFSAICQAFEAFSVSLDDLDAVAVAVFDHGDAPPGYSDRQFRFDYLDRRIRQENRLSAFAYPVAEIPSIMTRLQAVAASAQDVDAPLVVMDTAPAAVLGACFDPQVAVLERKLVANVGNFHTLAFRLGPEGIEGTFEHHTGLIDRPKLERLLHALADGTLQHSDVFADHGHGALIYQKSPLKLGFDGFDVAVSGPRRSLMYGAETLRTYFPAPFGDMMIAGCFGLLAATADVLPELGETITESLQNRRAGQTPWDVG